MLDLGSKDEGNNRYPLKNKRIAKGVEQKTLDLL